MIALWEIARHTTGQARGVRTGELGFWWRSAGGAAPTRPPLDGPSEADVAIVGAGYTGLWAAYYLKQAEPSLRIVVLERELAGYGASGRNGGWLSGFFSGPPRLYERHGGRAGLAALQRAMFDTVGEVGLVLAREGIDADFVRDGHLSVALGEAQALRLHEHLRSSRSQGLTEQDLRALSTEELAQRVRVAGATAASFPPHVARV